MKVLITGGTGFIGCRLALYCSEQGHAVRVLGQVNNEAERQNKAWIEAAGAEVALGSLTDREATRAAVDGMEVVFHLAAAQHEANVPDQLFWDVNVAGTRALLDAALEAGVRRFVYGSTIGVYGALEGEIDEQSPVDPDNIYGVTKLEAERLVLSYADRLPVTAVRISETYGPGDRRLLKLFKAIKGKVFFRIGNGRNKHHLIYIDDLIEGLWLAATSEKVLGDMVVLSGKDAPTTDDMVDTIASQFDQRISGFRAPLGLFLLAAWILEHTLRPLGIQPPLHRRRMDFFKKSFTFSARRASDLLGFEPAVGFREGLAETGKWYEERGML